MVKQKNELALEKAGLEEQIAAAEKSNAPLFKLQLFGGILWGSMLAFTVLYGLLVRTGTDRRSDSSYSIS